MALSYIVIKNQKRCDTLAITAGINLPPTATRAEKAQGFPHFSRQNRHHIKRPHKTIQPLKARVLLLVRQKTHGSCSWTCLGPGCRFNSTFKLICLQRHMLRRPSKCPLKSHKLILIDPSSWPKHRLVSNENNVYVFIYVFFFLDFGWPWLWSRPVVAEKKKQPVMARFVWLPRVQ